MFYLFQKSTANGRAFLVVVKVDVAGKNNRQGIMEQKRVSMYVAMHVLKFLHHIPHKVIGLALLYAAGIVFLMSTNPAHLPLPLIMVPFLWLFVTIFATGWVVLGVIGPFRARRQRLLVAGAMSTLPVLMLIFKSIHQLTARDVILAIALVGVATFYVSRADFIK